MENGNDTHYEKAGIPEPWWEHCYTNEEGMIFTPFVNGAGEVEKTGEERYQELMKAREPADPGERPRPALEEVKRERVEYSKAALAAYLEGNPLSYQGKSYSVTQEKQNQMTSVLLMAQGAAQAGIPYELTWNCTGEACVSWTLEELSALAYAMNNYVRPLVTEQQYTELAVNACTTYEEVEAVRVDYVQCPNTP